MKAVILAAGRGTRMPEYTAQTPKALVSVGGVPILERILDAIQIVGIRDVVITTGHFSEKLKAFIASQKKFTEMNITYAFDPDYATTNYIASMWAARRLLDEDILLFHGDMVFDQHILEGIQKSKTSAVCVREGGKLPEKDFKARVQDGRVVEIGVDVFGPDACACMPIYKLRKADMGLWMTEIGKLVKAGDVLSYAEKGLNAASDRIHLAAFPCTMEDICMEVDTVEDLREAERLLSARNS